MGRLLGGDVEGMSEEAVFTLLFPGSGDDGAVLTDQDWPCFRRDFAWTGFALKRMHAEYGLTSPIWTIPGGTAHLPELDRRHVAQRRVDPEAVIPVHAVRGLGPGLARRAERLTVDELGLQYFVGRFVDGVVVPRRRRRAAGHAPPPLGPR